MAEASDRSVRSMMRTKGIHHVVLTVTDVARSTAFYRRVLGMEVLQESDRVSVLADRGGMLCLQVPASGPALDESFDERRPGLDHVAFSVRDRADLEATLEVLEEMNVPTAGIEFDPDGQAEYVCFRDPDNIQVEVYVWTEYSSGLASLRKRGVQP